MIGCKEEIWRNACFTAPVTKSLCFVVNSKQNNEYDFARIRFRCKKNIELN